jgi:integrase
MLYCLILRQLVILYMSSSRVKLTKSFIDQLELTPAIYRDSELIGFAVRVNHSYRTYIVEKKVLGQTVRSTIGRSENMTLFQAREIAKTTLFQMSLGVNPNLEKKKKKNISHNRTLNLTVKNAFTQYLSLKTLKQRTIDDYILVINKYLLDWQLFKLGQITSEMVQSKHMELSKVSKAQANMAMRVFRAVYNFSIKQYATDYHELTYISHNPVHILNHKKLWNSLKPIKLNIDKKQLDDLISAIFLYQDRGQQLNTNRDFLITLLLTGLRLDECAALAWKNINLEQKTITLLDLPNKGKYVLLMGDFLFELMKKRKQGINGKWVFPSIKSKVGHITNIAKVRDKIYKASGIKFTFYDLKRMFYSIVQVLNFDFHTTQKLLHRKYDISDTDISINESHLRDAMNEIENIILKEYKQGYMEKFKKE